MFDDSSNSSAPDTGTQPAAPSAPRPGSLLRNVMIGALIGMSSRDTVRFTNSKGATPMEQKPSTQTGLNGWQFSDDPYAGRFADSDSEQSANARSKKLNDAVLSVDTSAKELPVINKDKV
jgi:hypothetical protein